MSYHASVYLFVFLPMVLLAYQLTPRRWRWITLLISSYAFFWSISGELVLYLIGTTLFTHYIAVWLAWMKEQCRKRLSEQPKDMHAEIKKQFRKKEKRILFFGVTGLLLVLVYLKYYNFFVENINGMFGIPQEIAVLQVHTWAIPIGISFYTLQAIGYMADVYWEKVEVHNHPGKLALFLGFFPQIMEGPLSMYAQTADALWKGDPLTAEDLSKGSVRVLWGLFKKMIIANRLHVLVKAIFEHHADYQGIMIVLAAVAYTVQLYMEFSGCMDIIIGSGKMFHVTLPENFRQPFASKNAAEFWRRWHITLGVWFKTYIFYPVSVSPFVKKCNKYAKANFGKYAARLVVSACCLLPVWLCNGLWHGASWNYIFYGIYYFVILMAEIALEPAVDFWTQRCRIDREAAYYKTLQILKTWVIIVTGELFFRADSLLTGLQMFFSIFRSSALPKPGEGVLHALGLDRADCFVIIAACMVVMVVESIKETKGSEALEPGRLRRPVRWAVYYALIFSIIIFGAYGAGYQQVDMIYAGF